MICETCGKPLPNEAIAAQREAMRPREVKEGYALIATRNALVAYGGKPLPDVRMGDLVRVTLIAAAVPDVTAGFYCECGEPCCGDPAADCQERCP